MKKKVIKKKVAPKAKKSAKPKAKSAKAKPAKRKSTPTVAKKVKAPKIQGKWIGRVTHYFPHVSAAVIKIEKERLKVGDQLYFKGHTSDFKTPVVSLQMDHSPIPEAKRGMEVGVQVPNRVREGDDVYKI